MKGQYSDDEFRNMIQQAGTFRSYVNYANRTAWIDYGKSTTNYYYQHEDGSWTNYKVTTK